MLDYIQSSYVGTQQGEKESTQKLTLTKAQRELIENNLIEIKKILKFIFGKTKACSKFGYPSDLVDEALSYLPDVTLEYKQSLANTLSFARFATQRCLLRLVDEHRKMNKHTRIDRQKKVQLDRIRKKIESTKGFCTDNDLALYLEEQGEDPYQAMCIRRCGKSSFDHADNMVVKYDRGLNQVDWLDLREGILRLSEKFFKEYPDDPETRARNLSSRVHKILIKDFILPRCEGLEAKTLGQIAIQVGLSEGRLSQMVHGERMKRFIEAVYN